MPKNHPAYNRKIKTSSLSLPIHQSIYARKNISPYFFCRSSGSLHTCDERFLIPPHFYKGIQKRFYHQNFSPFTNCLQTKKKHLSLFLPIQRHFERINISLFSLYLQAKKKAPHFTWDFRSTLTTLKSFFLQIVYILNPFLK